MAFMIWIIKTVMPQDLHPIFRGNRRLLAALTNTHTKTALGH